MLLGLGWKIARWRARVQLSPFSDAQPHLVFAWKRCAHEDFECVVILFRDDGNVFDAHDPSSLHRSLPRISSDENLAPQYILTALRALLCCHCATRVGCPYKRCAQRHRTMIS